MKMKTKILIALLVVVIVALGVLFGMKVVMQKKEENTTISNDTEEDSTLNVVLEDEKKDEPKSKYDGNKRTLAVMIDNVGDAIPQTSLNEAMLVYEVTVEGGLTRFMAVYKDPKIDTIGPVRSARPYFIDYAMENDSIYIHYGGSPKALEEVQKLNIASINGLYSPGNVYSRTNKKKAPHNALVSVKEIWNYAESQKIRTTTKERNVLNYSVETIDLTNGTLANTVNIPYSSSKVKFVYNAEKQIYERYVGNKLQKDWLTGEALTTKNIIVTFANNYGTNEEGKENYRQALENIGTLNGYYITNGKAEKIKCKKTTRSGKTVYQDLEGNEIKVNDGNTYIQIVPLDLNVTFG